MSHTRRFHAVYTSATPSGAPDRRVDTRESEGLHNRSIARRASDAEAPPFL